MMNIIFNKEILRRRDSLSDSLLFWSLCALFFFIPVATSPAELSATAVLAVWVLTGKAYRDRQRWLGQAWAVPVLLYVLLHWGGLLWTKDSQSGLQFALKSCSLLFALVIASLSGGRRDGRLFAGCFLGGLMVTALLSLVQLAGYLVLFRSFPSDMVNTLSHSDIPYDAIRSVADRLFIAPELFYRLVRKFYYFVLHRQGMPTGLMFHITYSLLLVFGLLVLSFLYRDSVGKARTKALLLMLLFFVSLAVIPGRSGYAAFFLTSPWIAWNMLGGKHLAKILAAILIAAGLLALSPTFQKRVGMAVSEVRDFSRTGNHASSVGIRLYLWERSVAMLRQNPLFGLGTGGFKQELLSMKDERTVPAMDHPHNSFLYAGTSFGLAGLAVLLWLFTAAFRKGWRSRTSLPGFSLIAFTAVMLIGSMTDTQITASATAKLFALLLGLNAAKES